MAQTAAVGGETMWGSDIGGYDGGTITPDVFVRWAQFAALTPIFEVGGVGETATFWDLGSAAVNGFRAAATLHYELVPYLYALAVRASRTGLPVVRPLGLDWPTDARAWSSDLEFTVGSQLLAAPVIDEGTSSSVYLPAGGWIDLFSGRRYAGGHTVSRRNGPRDFPLYLRSGAALPLSLRTPRIWASDWRPDDLLRNGRQGWLAAPVRGGRATSIPDRGSVLVASSDRAGTTRLTVTHALREEQFLLYPPVEVCSVIASGRPLSRVGLAGLPARGSAWTRYRRGVLVKVSGPPGTLALRALPCGLARVHQG
jgi:alpha-D-xyloside xylohydrolase